MIAIKYVEGKGNYVAYMRIVCLMAILGLFLAPLASAEPGGVDIVPEIDNTPVEEIQYDKNPRQLSNWSIAITLNETAANNNTTVEILIQMCDNNGMCYRPFSTDVNTTDNNTVWSTSIETLKDITYVHWRYILNYSDGTSEEFPPKGQWAVSWSSCWRCLDNDAWGGPDCPDGPVENLSSNMTLDGELKGEAVPGFSFSILATALVGAALLRRR